MLYTKELILFCLVAALPAFAVEPQTITVKISNRVHGTVRSFEVDIPGRSTELFCFEEIEGCNDLLPGRYSMVPSPTGKYQDCDDVDIYPYGADPSKVKPLGTYGLQWP